jgi:DNA-binding MarR family transcriptional regulator
MADQFANALAVQMSEADIRRGVELLYFGYSHLTRAIDNRLATQGLGRAHHRALYFIARQPGLTVSALLRLLNITKQSLARVINDLAERDLVISRPGISDRRQRCLTLTESGTHLEVSLFQDLRNKLSFAYNSTTREAVSGFWTVLEGLVPADERAMVLALQRPNHKEGTQRGS